MNQHLDPRLFARNTGNDISRCKEWQHILKKKKKNCYSWDISVTLGTKTMFLKNGDEEYKVSSNLLTNYRFLVAGGSQTVPTMNYKLLIFT